MQTKPFSDETLTGTTKCKSRDNEPKISIMDTYEEPRLENAYKQLEELEQLWEREDMEKNSKNL